MLLLTGFGLGCLFIVALILIRDLSGYSLAKVFLGILLSSCLLLITPLVDPQHQWLIWNITTATPAMFWLLCQLAFDKPPKLLSLWSFVALYSFIAPAIVRSIGVPEFSDGFGFWIGWNIPRYTEYALVGRGLWLIISKWNDDLVESRRRLRAALLLVIGISVFGVTFSVNNAFETEISLSLIVSLASIVSALFVLKAQDEFLVVNKRERDHRRPSMTKDCARLNELMSDGFYRAEFLTLKKLSRKMELSEYKLRMVINQELGYRNFNDYINQLRISEAKALLVKTPEAPILNIALDIGYRNISSFNRAFKDIVQKTPSQYRRENVGDGTMSLITN